MTFIPYHQSTSKCKNYKGRKKRVEFLLTTLPPIVTLSSENGQIWADMGRYGQLLPPKIQEFEMVQTKHSWFMCRLRDIAQTINN